jgi:hypothetical protein
MAPLLSGDCEGTVMHTHKSKIVTVAVISLSLLAFPAFFSPAATPQSATLAYIQRAQIILTQVAMQTISTHSELLRGGSFWLTCRVDAHGKVQNVEVVFRNWGCPRGKDALVSALKSVTLPPIPRDVLLEGENWIDVKTHIRIDEGLTNR